MRNLYAEKRRTMLAALEAEFGDALEIVGDDAGMHLVAFLPAGMSAWRSENAFEFNVLLQIGPILWQPVVQYYTNVGGGTHDAMVCGFRTKVEF